MGSLYTNALEHGEDVSFWGPTKAPVTNAFEKYMTLFKIVINSYEIHFSVLTLACICGIKGNNIRWNFPVNSPANTEQCVHSIPVFTGICKMGRYLCHCVIRLATDGGWKHFLCDPSLERRKNTNWTDLTTSKMLVRILKRF